MKKCEALDDIVRCVGSLTYGKERWFDEGNTWYDRKLCDHISNEELVNRVCDAIKDEIGE